MKKRTPALLVLIFLLCVPAFADSKNLVYNESFDFKDIDSLKISLSYEHLKISQIYGDEIVIEIGSNNRKKIPQVELVQEDFCTTLEIKTIVKKVTFGTNCTVYLYLPQDFLPDLIDISMVSGNLLADILRSQNELKLANVSGRTDIASSITDFLNASSVSGNITLQKVSAGYFSIENVSGNVFVELEDQILAKSNISTISGKIQVYHKNNESPFTDDSPELKVSSISGKVEVIAY